MRKIYNQTLSKLLLYTLTIFFNVSGKAQCNASFIYNIGGTTVNFTSTSTGTNLATLHQWFFGDGTSSITSSTVSTMTHTYPYNGTYTAWMSISNSTCTDSTSQNVIITNGTSCSLNSNFTYTLGANGQVSFASASTGTTNATAYSWNFGAFNNSNAANPSYTFPSNGIYTVNLTVSDSLYPYVCNSTSSQTINITSATNCPLMRPLHIQLRAVMSAL